MKFTVKCCALVLTLIVISAGMSAQTASAPPNRGIVEDWSTRQIVFSRGALLQNPDLLYREPRVLAQAMTRWQATSSGKTAAMSNPAMVNPAVTSGKINVTRAGDWNISLGKSHVAADMYPVKYSNDPTQPPDCQNDFAAFGLTVAGVDGGTSNLVALNNLYSPNGVCQVPAPTVFFSYNTTTIAGLGKITTSPVLSLDGKKVAFVESVAGSQAIFHVLTWTRGQGTIAAAAHPAAMTSLTFSPTSGDTLSSPWIDYSTDTAYVGSDNGVMYKITGVFKSTPVLAASWPITSNKYRLGPPVLDSSRNLLVVGSGNASLYAIDVTTGIVQASQAIGAIGAKYAATISSPVIDITTGFVFAVSADDGSTAVLKQLTTSTLGVVATARIGIGGTPATTALVIQEPSLDNNYYNDPASGTIRVCGTSPTDTSPYEYAFGFSPAGVMNTSSSLARSLSTSTAARCTPMREFYNPNLAGGTDFFFFGLTQDCTAPGATGGCVISEGQNNVLTTATVNGGPSGVIPDNYSTLSQAHSIYFTATKQNTAYKRYQDTLQ